MKEKGSVTISTSMELSIIGSIISLALLGGSYLNKKIETHEQSDIATVQQVASDTATIQAINADIKDIKDTQRQELQIISSLNKRI